MQAKGQQGGATRAQLPSTLPPFLGSQSSQREPTVNGTVRVVTALSAGGSKSGMSSTGMKQQQAAGIYISVLGLGIIW